MATTLLCKRLISGRNLYCSSSLRHQATQMRDYRGRSRKVASEVKGEEKGCFVSMDYEGHHAFGAMCIRFNLYGALDPPSVSSCNSFLKDLLKPWSSPRLAKQFLAYMLVLGAIPCLSTFSIIIKSYCRNHKYHDVLDLVGKQMEALEVKADASFCKALMVAACACYKPYACHYLLQRLRSTHQGQLPLACYDTIFRQFCPRKPIKDATGLMVVLHELSKMRQLGVYPDEKIYYILLNTEKFPIDADDYYDDEKLCKAMMMGSLMFSEGIRVGAVNPTTAYGDAHKGEHCGVGSQLVR